MPRRRILQPRDSLPPPAADQPPPKPPLQEQEPPPRPRIVVEDEQPKRGRKNRAFAIREFVRWTRVAFIDHLAGPGDFKWHQLDVLTKLAAKLPGIVQKLNQEVDRINERLDR